MTDGRTATASTEIPPELDRWNWGAFLLSWIWGIGNNTAIALLTLIPGLGLVMMVVLGLRGSRWAWRYGHWDSVEHFKRVQRKWAIWAVIIWFALIVLGGAFFAGISLLLRNSDAYRLAAARLQASTEAAERLGAPITTGVPTGSIKVSGDTGEATLNFSASGPKATGQISLDAVKKDGVWSFKILTLKVDGGDAVIDLLSGSRVELDRPRPRLAMTSSDNNEPALLR